MKVGETLLVMTIVKKFTVRNVEGWHARPCAIISRIVVKYPKISVTFFHHESNTTASGASVFELMVLAVSCGDTITVTITGNNLKQINKLMDILKKIINDPNLTKN